MDRQYIKIAQYADFKGKTKQAIYQSKKIKKTVLEDGSKVILFKDLPEEEAKEVAVFLEKCLIESGNQSTEDKAAMQEKFNAILLEHAELMKKHEALTAEHAELQKAHDALVAEHAKLQEGHAAMVTDYERLKHDLEKETEITQLVKKRCEDLEQDKQNLEKDKQNLQERCKEANILLLRKIPNAWNPSRLLPWNWGKKQEEI